MSRTATEVMAHIASMIADLPDGYDTAERRTSIAVSCALGHVALGHENSRLYGILLTWWHGTIQRGVDPTRHGRAAPGLLRPAWIRDAAVLVPLCDQDIGDRRRGSTCTTTACAPRAGRPARPPCAQTPRTVAP